MEKLQELQMKGFWKSMWVKMFTKVILQMYFL